MKKICIFALVLVLTASMFAGCRSTNDTQTTTGTRPTRPATEATTVPTTEATTPTTEEPTDVTTTPTDGMIDPSESPAEAGTDGNPATGDMDRGRGILGMQ